MSSVRPILIAGGGIGGLALALALSRFGRSSILLEKRRQPATEGAGIQIGPNGVHVLRRLGLTEALQQLVGEPEAVEICAGGTSRLLARLPLGASIAARHGAPYWVVHRSDLHNVLLAAANTAPGITIRSGFELASVAQTGDEVCATSVGGETIAGAALVGADGLWSAVRQAITPSAVPQFVGATASRTVIPADRAGRLAAPAVGLWLSPGVNVVHYPVRGGAEIALVVIATENWQGREWDAKADGAALLSRLSSFHSTLTDALGSATDWRKWALHRLPPLERWSSGRVTLLGDAAHPMLPHLAQGGVLALEDAVVLSECLNRHTDAVDALRVYEKARRGRAAQVQAASRRQGRIYHLAPPLSWARDAVLRLLPGSRLLSSLDWLYGWRADRDVP